MSNRSRFGALLRGFVVCAVGAYLLTVGMLTTINIIAGGHLHATCRDTRPPLHSPARRDLVQGSKSAAPDKAIQAAISQADAFGSLQAAARAALAAIVPLSSQNEWGGLIVLYKSKYYVVTPSTDGEHASVSFSFSVPPPLTLAATYHSHPCDPKYLSSKFSINDVFSAAYAEVPAFIVDVCDGTVYESDPNHSGLDAQGLVDLLAYGWADGVVVFQPKH